MGLFQEYMDSKGKVRKPVEDISGGDPDPKTPPTKPPKEHGAKPYANSDGKDKKKSGKGFGDQGDESLKYKPSETPSSKGHAPAKIPTVEQAEISGFVCEAIDKDPTLVGRLVSDLKNDGSLGCLVAEIFQHRASYDYMAEVMSHEKYGPEICERLSRALNRPELGKGKVVAEEVAPPFQIRST